LGRADYSSRWDIDKRPCIGSGNALALVDEIGVIMNKKIYGKLTEVAKKGTVIYESDLAKAASMNMSLPHERRELDRLLDEINSYEREQGHPVLSAVVIQKDSHMPNRHFFEFCRDIGLLKGADEDEFYIRELRNVYVFWAPH
jgi:hypothetical protein